MCLFKSLLAHFTREALGFLLFGSRQSNFSLSFFFLLEKCNTFFILTKQEIERLLLALPFYDPFAADVRGKKGRRWSLLRLQPLQIPAFCLWNIFLHVIFKPNCITLITEFLMWPDEGSSYLLHFGTPALTTPSPDRLLCCCQQDCFPFGFLMNISIQSIFCIFIGRPQTCGLSSLDIGSICRSQRGVQAAAPSHATPSTHRCRCSRSHPIPSPCFTSLSILSRLCPAHQAAALNPPFHTPAATALQ